jgi:hypothetical protein
VSQLGIGLVLFALLMIPCTLAYLALCHRSAALLVALVIALIPSFVIARLFGFVLLDAFEIGASLWRTRVTGRGASGNSS